MLKKKKSKEDRIRDRKIVELYHKILTEEELEPLYRNFLAWKEGHLPYYELTELIHEFHKTNQKIWSMFNYPGWNDELLILQAKKELNLLNDAEKEAYKAFLQY